MTKSNPIWELYWNEAPKDADFVIQINKRAMKVIKKLLKDDKTRAARLWDSFQKLYYQKYWPPDNPNSSLKIRTCGQDVNGYTVYKFRGDHRHIRGYLRVIRNKDMGELPIILIDDLTTTHDEDGALRHKVLGRASNIKEIKDVVLPIEPDKQSPERILGHPEAQYRQLLYVPFKEIDSALTWLDSSANIIPTRRQIESIYAPTPILINGQAGTGKTTMLAVRAAWIIVNLRKHSAEGSILCTAYSRKVVELLRNNIEDALLYKHRQSARMEHDNIAEFKTFPDVLRDLLDERTKMRFERQENRVGFGRFNREFLQVEKQYGRVKRTSAEFAWYVIRSLLKGLKMVDEPLTIDDFASMNPNGTIPKKITRELTRDDLEQMINLNKRYIKWLKENGFYDDIDLAFAAWKTIKDSPPALYYEIYLDEAQDLTRVEFRVLEALLSANSPLPTKGIRIALAGDPQQTINPTGFNWKHIKALFYKGKELQQTDLEINQRTPQPIVNLANEIQRRRTYYGKEQLVEQRAREQSGRSPSCFGITGHLDDDALIRLLKRPRPGTALVIWEEDDKEIIEFIATDPHLSIVANNIYGEEKIAALVAGTPVDITVDEVLASLRLHTIIDIKGLEFERVIFYKIASRPRFQDFAEETVSDSDVDEEFKARIPILYHLNKLYIAVTRPTRNLFIFDLNDAIDHVWGRLRHLDMSNRNNLREINADPALAAEEDRDWVTDAQKYLELFREERDRRMLAYALDCLYRAPHNALAQSILTEVKAELLEHDAAESMHKKDFERARSLWKQAGDNWSTFGVHRLKTINCYVQGESWQELRRTLETFSVRKLEHEGLYLYAVLRCSEDNESKQAAIDFFNFLVRNPKVVQNEDWWDYLSSQLKRLRLTAELIKLQMDVCWGGSREDIKYPTRLCDWLLKQNEYKSIISILEKKRLQRKLGKYYQNAQKALAEAAIKNLQWEEAGKHWKALANSGVKDDKASVYNRSAAHAYSEAAIQGADLSWGEAAYCYDKADGPDSPNTQIAEAETAANSAFYLEAFKSLSSAMRKISMLTDPLKRKYSTNYILTRLRIWSEKIDSLDLSRDSGALNAVVEFYLYVGERTSAKNILAQIINLPNIEDKEQILLRLANLETEDGNTSKALVYFERAENYTLSWHIAQEHRGELDQITLQRVEGRFLAQQYKNKPETSEKLVDRAISLLLEAGETKDAEELRNLRIERESDLREKVRWVLSRSPAFDTFMDAVKIVNGSLQDQNQYEARIILLHHLAQNEQFVEIEHSISHLRSELAGWMRDSTFVIPAQPEFTEREWGFLVECGHDDLSAKAYYQARSSKQDWARNGFRRVVGLMIKEFLIQAKTDYKKREFVDALRQELADIESKWLAGTPVSLKRSLGEIALMRQKLENETVVQLRDRWKEAGIPKYSSVTKDVLIDLYLHFWAGEI